MTSTTPFITQSRQGVWYYQRWIPLHFCKHNPNIKKVFRLSLHTRNKREASRLSRLLSVKIDELALQLFDSPEEFGEAMAILYESAKMLQRDPSGCGFEYSDFLSGVEEYRSYIYDKAYVFQGQINGNFQKLEKEIEFLRKAVLRSGSSSTTGDNRQLIDDIHESIYPTLPDAKNPTLESLFNEWSEDKQETMRKSSFIEYQRMIGLFIKIITDYNGDSIRINALGAEHIRNYKKTLSIIPTRTVTDNYSVSQLVKLSGEKKSPKTINNTCSNVGTFFKWIASKGYPIDKGLHEVLTYFDKIKDKEKKQRVVLSDDNLKHLFNSEKYTKTGKFYTSGMYWIGLIALFTGARMSEILQLEKHDIVKDKESKLWVISIDDIDYQTEDEDKHVKSQDGSRREVPIHKTLIKLGFLKYVDFIDGRLFPDEPRTKTGKFDAFEKRFTTYRKQVGVIPEHKMELRDFHSFRHTVRTRLSEIRRTGNASQQFDEGLIDAIIGHASKDRSIGETRYTHSQYIKEKSKALNRLQYDCIDFDMIKHWKNCDPWRKEFKKEQLENRTRTKST